MRHIHAPPEHWWRSMALLSGGLFLLGAGISAAAALSHALGAAHDMAYLALALAFTVVAVLPVAARRPLSMRALHLVGLLAIVGLSVGVALGDPVWPTYLPFYAWLAAVFALAATPRCLVVTLAEIVVGLALALAFHPAAADVTVGASWMVVVVGLTLFIHAARSTIGRSLRQERDLEVERYHSLLETLPGVVYRCRIDREWTLELLGPGVVELTGYTSEALLAKKPAFSSLMNGDDSAAAWEVVENALAAGEAFHTRYRLTRRDGTEIWIEDWSRPTHGRDGAMLEGILFDVTREVNERAQADAVREEYRALVETIPLVTYVDALQPDLPALYLSPQLQMILGYTDEEWRDESTRWVNLLHPDDREEAVSENRLHIETGRPFRMEYRLRARDGSWRWFLDESVIMRDQDGVPIKSRGYMVDLTPQKELEHQLVHAAFHDSLTDLANRALFRDRIEHALSRGPSGVAVIYVDLDDFKAINDSLGHGVGDDVIRMAADRLRQTVRRSDTLARLGGDEFAILVEDDPGEGASVARAVLDAFSRPIVAAGRRFELGASVGVATGDAVEDAEALIQRADLAMYAAKAKGKGRLELYTEALGGSVRNRLEVKSDLRQALADDALQLFFQPIVDLTDGTTVGAEALMRWEHPTKGWVAPNDFIPIAEEAGLVVELGRLALAKSAEAVEVLREQLGAPGFFVSVNLSTREILEDDIVEFIHELMCERLVAPDSLVLELTESLLLRDPELAIARLDRLRSLGFLVALDDFGTGYSSLGHLGRMPVDIVKIAKPFVDAVGTGSREEQLLAALIPLARDLGIAVVAEGIERPNQAVELVRLGCRLGQGFMYSTPLPLERLLAEHRLAPLRERRHSASLYLDGLVRAGTAPSGRPDTRSGAPSASG